jgi:hypothetical protein
MTMTCGARVGGNNLSVGVGVGWLADGGVA